MVTALTGLPFVVEDPPAEPSAEYVARQGAELAEASDRDITVWGLSRVISWNDSTRTLRIISARLRGQDGPVS